jgi:predicted esterase
MMMDAVRECSFSVRRDCHYLLRTPATIDDHTLLVAALHGYGQNSDIMLQLCGKMFDAHHAIASLQGPNQFFVDAASRDVGFGWNTKRHAAESIRLHHEMVLHVLNEAGREYAIPPRRRVLVGFSQPVALNYRFAATFPDAVRGVIGICGGLPGDWEEGNYQPVKASVLHIARREDEYYPPSITEHYAERLRLRVEDAEYRLIDGGHRFPSKGAAIVESWLDRILR